MDPPVTAAEVDHGVTLFLDQLVDALRLGRASSNDIATTAVLHGRDRRVQGLTVSQVVHDYGDVCQSITELAVETNAPIGTEDFRLLNGCLDVAIAGAVTQYGRDRNQATLESGMLHENERLGFFAHELRNLIQTALFAFEVVKAGEVGASGNTGAVLQRSLISARDLIARSLAEVRLTQGVRHPEPFLVSGLVDEVVEGARYAAVAQGIVLEVAEVDPAAAVEADRQMLSAVVTNLIQNAIKFTRPHTTVTVRVGLGAERVLIEVHDECGGLPGPPDGSELFRPFEQRGADRTGVGLGLAFARWAVEANHGRIYARSISRHGCVFTVDLPRCAAPAAAAALSA